jgi:UDP-3-O-[3-hydroxymyristoyl] N-acetylglucosamine deacetylase
MQVQMQRTLARTVETEGIGLHSGSRVRLRLTPGGLDSGLMFARRDLGGTPFPASYRLLTGTSYSTTLARGQDLIATVEHLLSALRGLGIDNAGIEVDGPEIPIMDGSALPFVELIREAGVRTQSRPRRFLTLTRPVWVKQGSKQILALPANEFQATYAIDFPHPAIGYQSVATEITEETYVDSIAAARTFCLLKDVEAMQRSGLALGGSLDNALVVGENGILNGSLRFPDEFVRHKVLDLVGDLALLGSPIRAHVITFKGGHRLHAALVSRMMESRGSWSIGTSEDRLPAARLAEFSHLKTRVVHQVPLAG